MSKIINASGQKNYVCGTKIHIYGEFNAPEFAELLGNTEDMISELSQRKPLQNISEIAAKLTSPYEITNDDTPIIDIYINSCGGQTSVLSSLSALLNIARANGIIIRTNVIGHADSSASLLAIQGTTGFRTMYNQAYHWVHYGKCTSSSTREGEEEEVLRFMKDRTESLKKVYLNHTNLNAKEIASYFKTEGKGFLPPETCLAKGLCDWILTDTGMWIKKNQLQR